jgi:hypothetical protein
VSPAFGEPTDVLERARCDLGMSVAELWFRYFSLGGMSTQLEIDAVLHRALIAVDDDRDRLAIALNERNAEQGGDHAVPYTGDGSANR